MSLVYWTSVEYGTASNKLKDPLVITNYEVLHYSYDTKEVRLEDQTRHDIHICHCPMIIVGHRTFLYILSKC